MVNLTILAGSYTAAISVFSFDTTARTLSLLSTQPAGLNPSWIALSPDRRTLFATQENAPDGGVAAFAVGRGGVLTQLSSAPSQGADPAHLLPTEDGRTVVVADYTSGGLIAFPVQRNGSLGAPGPLLTLEGSGPNAVRQAGAHPHEVVELDSGELLVPDLGSDKIWRVTRGPNNALALKGSIEQAPGSGPRHIKVVGSSLYTLHELDNTLTQQTLPSPRAAPRLLANVSVLPDGANPADYGAAELLRGVPDGLLYASNRNIGPSPDPAGDTIAILETAPKLRVVKQVATGLQQLRGVSMSNGGRWIVAAGLTGGGVAVFERVEGGYDLKLAARYAGPGSASVSAFVWL